MSAFDAVAASGVLDPLDLHFARLMRRRARSGGSGSADLVSLTAALVSSQRSLGHSCIDLRDWAGRPFPTEGGVFLPAFPDLQTWRRALGDSGLVGAGDDRETTAPLMRDGAGRLYLTRYWRAEQRLAANLRARRSSKPPAIDAPTLKSLFCRLFPEPAADLQALAAATALAGRVTLISGGPGTGKTTTVGRLLALLLAADPDLEVALAAPTGKAAARLGEAVAEQAAALPIPDRLRARFPEGASTLHRLLGYQPSRDRFRHHAGRPLAASALVIDEVSMVDLLLIDAAIHALSPDARIILLGDKDQLTSVETGSVFGDLCATADLGTEATPDRSPRFADFFHALSGQRPAVRAPAADRPSGLLHGAAVELVTSYRFRDQPGIGELAAHLRHGDAAGAVAVLDDPRRVEVSRLDPSADAGTALAPMLESLDAYLAARSPAEALERLGRFRILCARRRGPWGVESLNLAVERHLVAGAYPSRWRAFGEPAGHGSFYPARPILITANDYQLGLFNGDLGVCWLDAGRLWAFFPGEPQRLPLARLPPHETAWAMTVHKAQGSEFDRVLLVLGDADARVMTRELLYTGATRARRSVMVIATEAVLRGAVTRRNRRVSGLADALRGTPAEPPAPPEAEPDTTDGEASGQMSLFG